MEHNVLMITPASTNPTVTDRRFPNVLRMCGRDDQQGDVAAQFIYILKAKTVAIVHDKTTYGLGLVKAMKQSLKKIAPGIKQPIFG